MTAKALIFLGGGKDVRMFNVLTQIEHEIDAKEDSKALRIIAKHKEQIPRLLKHAMAKKRVKMNFRVYIQGNGWLICTLTMRPSRRSKLRSLAKAI